MAETTVIVVEKSYGIFINESSWGEMPGSPTRVHIPLTSCGVRFRPQNRQSTPRTGLMQRKHSVNTKGHPSGNIVAPLYGWHPTGASMSAAQFLMEWGFLDHESKTPRSKVVEWAVGPDVANRRNLGCRVNTATLSGSESGISLSLEVIGKSSTGFATADSLPADRNGCVEYLFEDIAFELDGTALPIGSFEWKVSRGLQPLYWDGHNPQALPKTQWVETFTITPPKQTDDWEDLRDALGATEKDAELVLKGLHMGTGATGDWDVLTITFPRLALLDVDMQESNGIYNEPLSFAVLKPDTSDLSSSLVWSEE